MSPEYSASTRCSTPNQTTALPGVSPLAATADSSKEIYGAGFPEFPWAQTAFPIDRPYTTDTTKARLMDSPPRIGRTLYTGENREVSTRRGTPGCADERFERKSHLQ